MSPPIPITIVAFIFFRYLFMNQTLKYFRILKQPCVWVWLLCTWGCVLGHVGHYGILKGYPFECLLLMINIGVLIHVVWKEWWGHSHQHRFQIIYNFLLWMDLKNARSYLPIHNIFSILKQFSVPCEIYANHVLNPKIFQEPLAYLQPKLISHTSALQRRRVFPWLLHAFDQSTSFSY